MTSFKAIHVTESEQGFNQKIVSCDIDDLPDHPVLIRVNYSSLNYKDALSATGNKGITRHYPHTPGIDAAGTVVSDASGKFKPGDQVVVMGFDLGMNTPGGFGQYIKVPADWPVTLPEGLTLKESMMYGTAGLTAAYCIEKLFSNGLNEDSGPILVTGATGGVGSFAVAILAGCGFEVEAETGKPEQAEWLLSLGASRVISRQEMSAQADRPILKPVWSAAIDTLGGIPLNNLLKQIEFGGSVASCGMVAGTALETSIFPFILRGVNLLGVASADAPLTNRQRVLGKLAGIWRCRVLQDLTEDISLSQVPDAIQTMLAGKNVRRKVLVHD